jgi:hypothetical protein
MFLGVVVGLLKEYVNKRGLMDYVVSEIINIHFAVLYNKVMSVSFYNYYLHGIHK